MIYAKSTREIALMKKAGECVADVFETLKAALHNGVSTLELDLLAAKVMEKHGCTSGSKGYYDYPGYICLFLSGRAGSPYGAHE